MRNAFRGRRRGEGKRGRRGGGGEKGQEEGEMKTAKT